MEYHRPKGLLAGFHALASGKEKTEISHAGEQWAPTDFFIRKHRHETWEFYLQVDGATRWIADDERYQVPAGSLFAVAPGVIHWMAERPPSSHHFCYAAIHLSGVTRRHPELKAALASRKTFQTDGAHALLTPFSRLIRELTVSLPRRDTGLRLCVDQLILEICRLLEARKHGETHALAVHPAVLRIRDLLDKEYQTAWSVPDLARIAGCSPGHLSECFTRETGVSLHQYQLCILFGVYSCYKPALHNAELTRRLRPEVRRLQARVGVQRRCYSAVRTNSSCSDFQPTT